MESQYAVVQPVCAVFCSTSQVERRAKIFSVHVNQNDHKISTFVFSPQFRNKLYYFYTA